MAKKVAYQAFLGSNYGTVLQSFALYQSIKKLGYECEVVGCDEFLNKPIPDPRHLDIFSKEFDKQLTQVRFEHFLVRWFKFNKILGNIPKNAVLTAEQKDEIKKFDAFVCGSDQIWMPGMFWFCAKRYLQYAPAEKRIGYAPSLGKNKVELHDIGNIPQWREWLTSVKYLSTRETTGTAIVSKVTGRHVETVLDPTFLLRPEDWNSFLPYGTVSDEINKILLTGKPYIVAYLLESYDTHKDYIQAVAKRLKTEIVWLTGRDNVGPVQRNCATTDPAGFIQLIRNAAFVCMDGFHGSCFSINFSKPFALLSIGDNTGNDSRIQDLFRRLKIEGRIIYPGDNPNKLELTMDYSAIRNNIEAEREKSLIYLKEALEGASERKGALFDRLKNTFDKAITSVSSIEAPRPTRTIDRVPLDDPNNCTGCGACMNMCPTQAIQMLPNKHGFLNPVVDDSKCVRCGKCLHNCPLRKHPNLFLREKLTKAYAAWATNPFIISRSASGGMFPLMAKWMFEQGGVAYGVAWNENLVAKTVCATNEEELKDLCGSKYVQADTGTTYRDVKEKLNTGIPVLFSGTSCQVAGLYAYLEGDHDLLVTTDLLCGGTPSPLTLRKYLDWREKQFKSKVVGLEFRSKKQNGWGLGMILKFANGKIKEFPMQNDEYGILYNQHFIQRPSCYVCRFRGIEKRWADISIGDFWGIGRHGIPFKHERSQGVSVVLPNSIKGRMLFQSIAADVKNVFVEERPLEEVYPGNAWLTQNYGKRKDYKKLNDLLSEKDFDEAFNEYFGDEAIRKILQL